MSDYTANNYPTDGVFLDGDTYTTARGVRFTRKGSSWVEYGDSMQPHPGDAKSFQVGGTHYTDMVIQPFEYIYKNDIRHLEGTAIGYLSRWRSKGGIEDLEKAVHAIQYLIEMEKEGA